MGVHSDAVGEIKSYCDDLIKIYEEVENVIIINGLILPLYPVLLSIEVFR